VFTHAPISADVAAYSAAKYQYIALVAHDNRKKDLMERVEWNCKILLQHNLICTGTTGKLIEEILALNDICQIGGVNRPTVKKMKSGPQCQTAGRKVMS
jgi:methylglyoxal synthase